MDERIPIEALLARGTWLRRLARGLTGDAAQAATPFLGGTLCVCAQYWYRDPGAGDGSGAGLTDAMRITLRP